MSTKRSKRPKKPNHFIQPNIYITPNHPIGDANLHIEGMSQELNFKNLSSVFPEKVTFDLVLSLHMVDQDTTAMITTENDTLGTQSHTIPQLYQDAPAVAGISWSQPMNVHFSDQGMVYPKNSSWKLAMKNDGYTYDTLSAGPVHLKENQYYSYGGLWVEGKNYDTISPSMIRCSTQFNTIQDQIPNGDSFGTELCRGGIEITLSPSEWTVLPIDVYRDDGQIRADDGPQPFDPSPVQHYRSMHYEMLGQNVMRVYFFHNNTS